MATFQYIIFAVGDINKKVYKQWWPRANPYCKRYHFHNILRPSYTVLQYSQQQWEVVWRFVLAKMTEKEGLLRCDWGEALCTFLLCVTRRGWGESQWETVYIGTNGKVSFCLLFFISVSLGRLAGVEMSFYLFLSTKPIHLWGQLFSIILQIE